MTDGCGCIFTLQQQQEIPSARSWAAPVRATGMVWKRQAVWLVHHIQISVVDQISHFIFEALI
jgi:hypothetical protein